MYLLKILFKISKIGFARNCEFSENFQMLEWRLLMSVHVQQTKQSHPFEPKQCAYDIQCPVYSFLHFIEFLFKKSEIVCKKQR